MADLKNKQIRDSYMDVLTKGTGTAIEDGDGNAFIGAIVNTLTSTSTTAPLAANQGKVLQDNKVAKSGDTMTGLLRNASGINFNASGGDTLKDYEDSDTFTVTDQSGAGLSFTQTQAAIVRIGRLVFVSCRIIYPSTASGANTSLGGFPFVFSNATSFLSLVRRTGSEYMLATIQSVGDNKIRIRDLQDGVLTNATLSEAVLDINYYHIL